MKKKLIVLAGTIVTAAPFIALAQGVSTSGASSNNCLLGSNGTLFGVLCQVGRLLNAVIPVLIALGVLYFVWGVVQYVIASDEEAKSAGRTRMIFGIIGLAVIVGMWGLVGLLRNTFGLNNTQNLELPTVPVVQCPPGQPGCVSQ